MDTSVGELSCSVAHEKLSSSGEVLKRTLHRKSELSLGRNEFGEIVLKIQLGKLTFKALLKDIVIHKKFAKDGKATLKLLKEKEQFMLSNCPPDKLLMFLRTLSVKLECLKQKGFVSDRKRLFSELPRTFEEISPLTLKDVQTVHNIRASKTENNPDIFTPKSKRRKTFINQKENAPIEGAIATKKSNHMPLTLKPAVVLNTEQKHVLQAIQGGSNVFFTGSAGTGKSFLLKKIIGSLAPQHTFATASTGVAACHIGGTTLHAFAGIGSGRAPLEQCIELASRPVIAQQWRKCHHLVIDEISMVDGEFFNKLEAVARVIKKSDKPFGGIQLILCGDFLQLPPVTKPGEKRKFAFQSEAWRNSIHSNLELVQVKRQDDPVFVSILQHVRFGRCPSDVLKTLQATHTHNIEKDGILATRLCTHKEDVDQINSIHLAKLQGASRVFEATDSDPCLVKAIDAQCPVSQSLTLKEGAQVMLTKNLDVHRGLVNGARGVVLGFEAGPHGLPKVRFVCGETITAQSERWSFKGAGGMYLSRRQLPLKLAWAISIHKSQGMSLDCVEISLAKVFECGQAYVALSRARSLEGLRVLDFHSGCVRADPQVLRFYNKLSKNPSITYIPLGGKNVH